MKVSRLWCTILFAGVLCTGTLCACSDDDDTPETPVDQPDDPTPDDPEGVRKLTMTVGELMYYGQFKQSKEDVYFLYLKDADPIVDCNIGLYVNVPTVTDKSNLHLPAGNYTADASGEPMTFTNKEVAEGKSFWWTITPKMTEHLVVTGSLEVKRLGDTYTIEGLLMESETEGIRISFEGKLPCEDCTGDEKPIRDVTLTVGELMYYGPYKESKEDVYFLYLKDADPIVDCNIGLYVNVPTVTDKNNLYLPAGTYAASASWEPMTLTDASVAEGKSFWWTISPELTQHLVASGSIEVKRSGDSYTITGTLMETETTGIRISFAGALPAEDWSGNDDPIPGGVTDITMTVGELMYYGADKEYGQGGDVFFLYLKDAEQVREYNMGLYVNVPKMSKSDLYLPDGTYQAASSWEPMTINDNRTEKYKSHWYSLDPWTQHLLESGSIEVSRTGTTYTITGTLMETEDSGVRITFTGELPVEDYSDDDPDPGTLTEVEMTVGELMYYGVEEGPNGVYYLSLKDAKPTQECEIALYINLPPPGDLGLAEGDYNASDTFEAMTCNNDLTSSASSWTTLTPERQRHKIASGSFHVARSGESYTLSGTFYEAAAEEGESPAGIRFTFTGDLPCEDYSY